MTKSLQSILSKEYIRDLAGDKVYMRGTDYYKKNTVDILFFTVDQAIAEVSGSHPYRVDLVLSDEGTLKADCTCPAMHNWGFCKHAVATSLFLMQAPPSSPNTNIPKNLKEDEDVFSKLYPNLAEWIKDGQIEIGRNGYSTSMIRLVDEGGIIWEGGTRHKSIDKILEEAELAMREWFRLD